jgi:signal transduction histidine kinase
MIAERCSGLLRRVGCGRPIEIHYGAAASVPVRVPEEAVERILVNLVRNAAAALGRRDSEPNTSRWAREGEIEARGAAADPTADVAPGTIRIGVGLLVNRVGDPKPWPFRRVRLTVEDSGCGMSPEQMERLLGSGRAPSRGSHGIGFQVVRELVEASDGDLRVMSAPGAGTRVQIEWPIAGGPAAETVERPGESDEGESSKSEERGQSC